MVPVAQSSETVYHSFADVWSLGPGWPETTAPEFELVGLGREYNETGICRCMVQWDWAGLIKKISAQSTKTGHLLLKTIR